MSRLTNLTHNLVGTASDNTQTFAYNPASQIRRRTASNDSYAIAGLYNVSRGYNVNGLNQYTAAGPASFGYDLNGNLSSDGTNSYRYDLENRLVSATEGGVGTTLSYDPLGRLFRVTRSGTSTDFLYDGDELVAEYSGTTLLKRYVHGIGIDDPVLWYEGAGLTTRRSLLANHQGSIVAVGDASGNMVAINGYDAWGIPNSANQGRFGYTGQIWIGEIGMWHYKARLYSPTLGRFLQTDPVGYEDQINLYAYVRNDPVNRYDANGEWDMTVHNRVFRQAVGDRFGFFSMQRIMNASMHQDWRGPDSNNNAAHYLRAPNQPVANAERQYRAYVNREIAAGREAVRTNDEKAAQRHFARAAHAVQDSFSPMHRDAEGPRVYVYDPNKSALRNAIDQGHSPFPWVGHETLRDVTPAVMARMTEATREIYRRIYCSSSKDILERRCGP